MVIINTSALGVLEYVRCVHDPGISGSAKSATFHAGRRLLETSDDAENLIVNSVKLIINEIFYRCKVVRFRSREGSWISNIQGMHIQTSTL